MDKDYLKLLDDLKSEIINVQNDIVLSANAKLIKLYYKIGQTINDNSKFGNKFVDNLASDLKLAFPNIKGFSRRNLYYMKKLNEVYDETFVNEIITKICWTNNQILLNKVQDVEIRKWYAVQESSK